MIGLIRLQWWKDALETLYATGQVKDHPLLHAIAKHRDDISHSDLNEMIDARMDECEALQPASWDEFVKYASAPQYATLKAAQGILYKRSDAHNHMASISEKDLKKESIKNPAIIYGAVGTLIRAPYDAMHQRMRLPSDLLAKHSLHQQDFYDASCAQKIKPFILTLTKKLKPYCILAPYDAVFAHQIVATRRLSRLAKDPTRLWQPVTAIDGAMLPLTLSFKKLLGQL
jgi:hypothetical protein